jgi:Initiator Replication protein
MPEALTAVASNPRVAADSAELRKPHEMIVMVPQTRRVTLTGRRIYNVLLQVAQARMAASDSLPLADFLFDAPLNALLRSTGSKGEDRTAAKRYLQEMQDLKVTWESTAPGDGVKWRGLHMLTEVVLEIRKGENWVSWSFPPSIMGALREPTRWARIDLGVLARLGTYAAVALYEICARYRDNPAGVTSRKPTAWWADALSHTPGGTERREWRKFKNERVKEAVDEINRETDLEIELIEHKQGRAVVDVQFAVRRKRTAAWQDVAPVDASLALRAESLGIREAKLEGLVQEFGEENVRQQLVQLERRAGNPKLRSIENPYSYLRTLLRAAGTSAEPAPEASEPSAPVAPAASPREWVDVDGERQAKRIAELKLEIGRLGPNERKVWADRALEDLARKGQLTAVVSRRAEQGDVLHGLLGATVVRIYAEATYGDRWAASAAVSRAAA